MNNAKSDFKDLSRYLITYQTIKTKKLGLFIEHLKNSSVDALMERRGKFQRHVWHSSMVGLLAAGVISSGALGGNSLLASSFPGAVEQDQRYVETFDPFASGVSLQSFIDLKTAISSKPRSEILDYQVKDGDTLSQIAEKFGVSIDTIKWANDDTANIRPGQILKILPVSGVAVKVKSGDSVENVAKRYTSDSQAIVDFPFNDIGEDLALKIGQTIIVPDGIPPENQEIQKPKLQPQFIAKIQTGTSYSAPGGGSFMWPTSIPFGLSQYFSWYHPGLDMPNPSSPPVVASDGGTVIVAGWPDNYGYGNRVLIDHGNGYQSLYAHLSNIYVSVGQTVSRGQTIGQMGNTGRSTGTHLHYEIRYRGVAVNPLAILK